MSAQRPRLSIDVDPKLNITLAYIAADKSRVLGKRVTIKDVVLEALQAYYGLLEGSD